MDKVPELLLQALSCKELKQTETKDWSAVVVECDNRQKKADERLEGQPYFGESDTPYWIATGTLARVGASGNLFETVYDAAQVSDPAAVPGMLGELMAHAPAGAGFSIVARVRLEHFDPADSVPNHRFSGSIDGSFTPDGRFDFRRVTPVVNGEGDPTTADHRTTFDLYRLQDLAVGDDCGVAYYRSSPNWQYGVEDHTSLARWIYRWAVDPFDVPAFPALETLESVAGDELLVEHIVHGAQGPFTSLRYRIAVGGPVPLPQSREVLDPFGNVVARTDYSDYQRTAGGSVRPMSWVETRFHGAPYTERPRFRVTVTVAQAVELTPQQAALVPEEFPMDQRWHVWQ